MEYAIMACTQQDADLIWEKYAEGDAPASPSGSETTGHRLVFRIAGGDGETVAGCVAGVSGWDAAHIDAIRVDGHYCGRGIGSYLLRAIEREAAENGVCIALTAAGRPEAAFFVRNGIPSPLYWKAFPSGSACRSISDAGPEGLPLPRPMRRPSGRPPSLPVFFEIRIDKYISI